MDLYGESLERMNLEIMKELPRIFRAVNGLLPESLQREGGYFSLHRDVATEAAMPPLLICQVGNPLQEKAVRSFGLCQEKAERLRRHSGHLCAAESADPARSMWPGAVRCEGFIFAFSGFPGNDPVGRDGDECLLLLLLQPSRWAGKNLIVPSERYLRQAAERANNKLFL